LLVNQQGRPVEGADSPIRYYTPEDGPPLAREFRPQEVMTTLGQLVWQVLHQAGVSGRDIVALGITSQRQGTVFLDGLGQELYCGPNIDLRAVFEGAALDSQFGPEIYRATGHTPSLLFAPARLRWFEEHQPALLDRARTLLSVAGWLGYRLSGQARGELGLDCELGLINVSTDTPPSGRAVHLLEKLGFRCDLLPPLINPGELVGQLLPGPAAAWGLVPGTPVTLAGTDSQCGLMGMGMGLAGQVGGVLGWSGCIQMLTARPELDLSGQRTWVSCYPVAGLYTTESNLGDVGNAYRWLVQTIGGGRFSYQDAEHLAAQATPGCEGVSVFLGPGPLSAPKTGLRMGGIIFPTPLSFQEATPGQMFRGYLESLSYSIKANLAVLAEVAGYAARGEPVEPCLHLGGSLSRSNILAATLANVLAIPVKRSRQPRITALGAAVAAWVLAGRFPSLQETLVECCDFEVYQPDPGRSAEYQDYYESWHRLYNRLCSLN
jgi:sugar (pentulose or hexulose) kinase